MSAQSHVHRYALDGEDRLVTIDEAVARLVATGETGRLYCPGCNRGVTASVDGVARFVHSSRNCQEEFYLRQLARYRLKERFDSGKPFVIGTVQHVLCREYRSCRFYIDGSCRGTDTREYDLHKVYDRCEFHLEPSPIADLVLEDSKGKRPPMYLYFRTNILDGLKWPPDILVIDMPLRNEAEIEAYVREPILEPEMNGSRHYEVFPRFWGPFKRRGGLSSVPLCNKA